MWLRNKIRDYLGISLLGQGIVEIQTRQHKDQVAIQEQINTIYTMQFGGEHSANRKMISDRIGEETIRRLKAEDLARKHTTGEL